MSNSTKGKDLLVGAVVGSVLGAVAALLLAPKSGKELRGDIAEQVNNITEKTQQVTGEVTQKTQEIAKTVSSHTSELYSKAKDAAINVAEGVRSWRDSSKVELNTEEEETVSEAAEDLVILGNR
jgi:gas vesicle protein